MSVSGSGELVTRVSNILYRYRFLIGFIVLLCIVYFGIFGGDVETDSFKIHGRDLSVSVQGTRYVEENFEDLHQFDPELIKYVRTRYLVPPSKSPYHFDHPEKNKKTDHGQWVRNYLKDKKNGVFIEAGANEGEFHSHTLDLEIELGWTGLLIECNPKVTPYLRTKRRKAWVAGVCISTSDHPAVLNFSSPDSWSYSGRLGPAWNLPVKTNWTYFDVESIPLYTIIAAAGLKEIDFFSFDVEGIEMDILKHFPFDKIKIKLMIVEVYFLSEAKRSELEQFLGSKGLQLVEKRAIDHIYVHQDFKVK